MHPPSARHAPVKSRFTIRACRSHDDFLSCLELQKRIWGYAESELYPARLFVNLTKVGGLVLGAFAPTEIMIGFAAAMPAWRDGQRYFHSLALGVTPRHERRGIGKALKWEQRRRALRAGIDLIEWTFDPMQARNAFFNIERLGAVAGRFVENYYGAVQSRLQQGLPSDRLICEWHLRSQRVRRAARGLSPRSGNLKGTVLAPVPPSFATIAASRPTEARALQASVRRRLVGHFRHGFVITGFVSDNLGGSYVLERIPKLIRNSP